MNYDITILLISIYLSLNDCLTIKQIKLIFK